MATRDFTEGVNIMPDGSTTGALIELLRNMLVREYKNDLYLVFGSLAGLDAARENHRSG